jgi:hypothetical protein
VAANTEGGEFSESCWKKKVTVHPGGLAKCVDSCKDYWDFKDHPVPSWHVSVQKDQLDDHWPTSWIVEARYFD